MKLRTGAFWGLAISLGMFALMLPLQLGRLLEFGWPATIAVGTLFAMPGLLAGALISRWARSRTALRAGFHGIFLGSLLEAFFFAEGLSTDIALALPVLAGLVGMVVANAASRRS